MQQPHGLYWRSVNMNIHGLLEQAQRRASKMITGLEHLCCEGRLTGMDGAVHPGEGSQGRPYSSFKYLKGALKESWRGAHSDRTRGICLKIKVFKRFTLDIRKK